MPQGTVKWFKSESGFGRISVDGQAEEALFNYINIRLQSPVPRSGQRVEFDLTEGAFSPVAVNVRVID